MVSFDDVRTAAVRLSGVTVRTPLLRSDALDAICGGKVWLKPENLQRTGSFKIRGAYNRLSALEPDERARGVVAFSSGNHAQGVALAARLLGMRATIVMPSDAPANKVGATRGHGAEVMFYDRLTEQREDIAGRLAAKTGATIVPPFDDLFVVAGQGTAGLEAIEDLAAMRVTADLAIVCCGGGDVGAHARVPLTSIAQPASDLGRQAAHVLLDRIAGRSSVVRHLTLPVSLVVRRSCGAGARPVPLAIAPLTVPL